MIIIQKGDGQSLTVKLKYYFKGEILNTVSIKGHYHMENCNAWEVHKGWSGLSSDWELSKPVD